MLTTIRRVSCSAASKAAVDRAELILHVREHFRQRRRVGNVRRVREDFVTFRQKFSRVLVQNILATGDQNHTEIFLRETFGDIVAHAASRADDNRQFHETHLVTKIFAAYDFATSAG